MQKSKKVRTNVHLTKEQRKDIAREAKKQRVSKAEIIRRAIERYFDRCE